MHRLQYVLWVRLVNGKGYNVLYHVTTREGWYGICSRGIDPMKSKGKLPLSWFVDARKIHWAILHITNRHGCQLADVVIVETSLTKADVKKSGVKGLYNRGELTPVNKILSSQRFDDFSHSPLEYKQ